MKTVHNSIEISYNEEKDVWEFTLRGRSRSAQSLSKAKEAIDKEPPEKRTQTFPRFDAYIFTYGHEDKIVSVTSIADDPYRATTYFWISSKDKSRSKEPASNLFPVNEHNTGVVAEIRRVRKEIDGLEKQKAAWHAKLQCATVPKEIT